MADYSLKNNPLVRTWMSGSFIDQDGERWGNKVKRPFNSSKYLLGWQASGSKMLVSFPYCHSQVGRVPLSPCERSKGILVWVRQRWQSSPVYDYNTEWEKQGLKSQHGFKITSSGTQKRFKKNFFFLQQPYICDLHWKLLLILSSCNHKDFYFFWIILLLKDNEWIWIFFHTSNSQPDSSVRFSSVTQSCPTLCNPMSHHHFMANRGETVETVSDFISWLQSPSAVILEPKKIKTLFDSLLSLSSRGSLVLHFLP